MSLCSTIAILSFYFFGIEEICIDVSEFLFFTVFFTSDNNNYFYIPNKFMNELETNKYVTRNKIIV